MPPFAGGGMGGADWNAAEGEAGHVLNRTHWVEGGLVEILPETTLTEGNATEVLAAIPPLGFVVGDNYIVKVNGAEYACVAGAYEDKGVPGISLIISDLNTFIAELPPEMVAETGLNVYIEVDVDVVPLPITLSIYHNSEIVHKLDPKFLPEGLPYVEENGVLLEETDAVEGTEPTFGKSWQIGKAPMVTAGETYTIIYNGAKYDCVCYSGESVGMNNGFINSGFLFGNFAVIGGADTGEPFAIVVNPTYQAIMALDLSGATSVRIGIMGKVYHKLDTNFLPVLVVKFAEREDGSLVSLSHTHQQMINALREFVPVIGCIRDFAKTGFRPAFVYCTWQDGYVVDISGGLEFHHPEGTGAAYGDYYLDGDTSNKTIGNELWRKSGNN